MKDHFSKYSALYPLTSKNADEIAQLVRIWLKHFGSPEIIQSDNGREFKGAVEVLLKRWGIIIKHGRPRTPQMFNDNTY